MSSELLMVLILSVGTGIVGLKVNSSALRGDASGRVVYVLGTAQPKRTDITGVLPPTLDISTDPKPLEKSRFYNLFVDGHWERLTKTSDSQSTEETGNWPDHPSAGDVKHLEETSKDGKWVTTNEEDYPSTEKSVRPASSSIIP